MDQPSDNTDLTVFLLTQVRNDARNAARVLEKAGIAARICPNVEDLCEQAVRGGAMVISEDVLEKPSLECLLKFLGRQPAWSDIPIVLLTASADLQRQTVRVLEFLGARANVTLLEKPLRAITLVSVVRTALRARTRQYEVRGLLDNYAREVEKSRTATAKFRALFEQTSVFAGVMTLDGTLTEANRLCLEVCGYTEEEVLGKKFWDCAWWRGSKETQRKIAEGTARATRGETYKEILTYLWADGSEHIVDFGLYPIRDQSGQVIILHPTGIDVTERHEQSRRTNFLIQLTQKLSLASEPAVINRIATREIGEFLYAHRCYFFQMEPNPDEVRVLPDWRRDKGKMLEGIYRLPEFGRDEMWETVRSQAVTVDDVRTHPWTKDFAASYEAIEVRAFHLRPFIHEGRWAACICVTSEEPRHWTAEEQSLVENAVARVWPLIERARAEKSLREANALLADKASHLETLVRQRTVRLQEMVEELESFSYSIAHDMRAPLRSLQGFSKLVLMDYASKLDATGADFLRRIARAADRMDNLIRDVLNYSQVVRADLTLERVDVDQLLRGIIETYPMLAPDRADVALDGPFPPVMGNEAMLTQVFSNLMGNSVKFVRNGLRPRLRVWSESRPEGVRFFVRDNGIGIPADQQQKIFEMFQRVDMSFEGTGIGLAIVKKAVERMGGKVGVESELEKGSTFWVELQPAHVQMEVAHEL